MASTTILADPPSLGLRGLWSQIANFSAVVLIGVLLYQGQHAQQQICKEDRELFRATTLELVDLTRSVKELAEDVRQLRQEFHKVRREAKQ